MAQQQPDLTGRRAGLWDLEEWLRRGQLFAFSAPFTTTALLGALWYFTTYPNSTGYVEDVIFATDTAIAWTLWFSGGGFAVTGIRGVNLFDGFTPPAGLAMGAGLLAPPATSLIIASGFAPAGFYGSILGRIRTLQTGSTAVTLQTAAVAANVSATMLVVDATD